MAHTALYRVEVVIETPMHCHSTVQEYVTATSAETARERAESRVAARGLLVHEVRSIARGRFVVESEPA